MAAAAVFAEVLDQFVEGFESGEPAAAAAGHRGIATRSLFWFEGASGLTRRSPRLRPAPVVDHGDSETQKLHPALPPAQRQAMELLNALGARLTASFTREELRSAFRSLAHAYHPDRHPDSSRVEKALLAATFASARSAYLVLQSQS